MKEETNPKIFEINVTKIFIFKNFKPKTKIQTGEGNDRCKRKKNSEKKLLPKK